jgi:hypothetical protein
LVAVAWHVVSELARRADDFVGIKAPDDSDGGVHFWIGRLTKVGCFTDVDADIG